MESRRSVSMSRRDVTPFPWDDSERKPGAGSVVVSGSGWDGSGGGGGIGGGGGGEIAPRLSSISTDDDDSESFPPQRYRRGSPRQRKGGVVFHQRVCARLRCYHIFFFVVEQGRRP